MRLREARRLLDGLAAGVPREAGTIRLELQKPIAKVIIDNTTVRNAITLHMMLDLLNAVEQLWKWDGAAVILCSADPNFFCAGGHLKQVKTALAEPDKGRCMAMAMATVLDQFMGLPMVTVAAVNGLAIGGGAELVTACDHRVASTAGQIHFVHGRLGLAPGWGGTGRLVAHVGRRRALRILTTALPINAVEGERIGLVDQIVEGSAIAGAERFLEPVCALPPSAVRAAKLQVAAGYHLRTSRGLFPETDAFTAVWAGDDHRNALTMVLQRMS
ncbi:MAG: enoyl-CoA hydratase/isomerase family protein [Proteobacteria bacterium]|nr:enoyl-CoA hydratase/isomerase family protein [Pseudomonadota bacterium]